MFKRDYFRAKLTLTERKRCVNGKACKKRTRRLDKHKQMGPCIYSIVKDSIGRGRKTRMAAVGLLYAGYIVQ